MAELKIEDIKPGMSVKLFWEIKEGDKTRLQQIEGLVLARKHKNEAGATITLRRVKDGVAVEWILPVYSPKIKKVELIKASKAKRAKLYFLRKKSQKEIQAKLRKAT